MASTLTGARAFLYQVVSHVGCRAPRTAGTAPYPVQLPPRPSGVQGNV